MRHLTLALLGVVVAACAANPSLAEQGRSAPDAAERFASLLQGGVSYDYDAFDSPSEQRDASDLVIIGTIADVVPGRVLPLGRAASQANLVIAVQEIIRGSTPDTKTVYVEVQLGSDMTVSQVRDAAPAGRLVLFLDDRTDLMPLEGETGRPSGASIYAPFVQGMIIEAGTGWVSGLVDSSEMSLHWRNLESFDVFVSALRQ